MYFRHPSENMSSSVGMMKFPIYIYIWKSKNHVPNHQAVDVYHCGSISFMNPQYTGVYQKQRMFFTCFGPLFQIQTEAQGVDKHIYIYIYGIPRPSKYPLPEWYVSRCLSHHVGTFTHYISSFMGAWRV